MANDLIKVKIKIPLNAQPKSYREWLNRLEDIKSGTRVGIYCRVSSCTQNKNGNLRKQIKFLRNKCEELGLVVVFIIRHVGSGWNPERFDELLNKCGKTGVAIIVALDLSRLVRHEKFHSTKDSKVMPLGRHMLDLAIRTKGTLLYTYGDPNLTSGQIANLQKNEVGMCERVKKTSVGRPIVRSETRALLRVGVSRLILQGMGFKTVWKMIGFKVTLKTVKKWGKDVRKGGNTILDRKGTL